MKKGIAIALVGMCFAACQHSEKEEIKLPAGVGSALNNRDTVTRPADDFFKYVNGGWVNRSRDPAGPRCMGIV